MDGCNLCGEGEGDANWGRLLCRCGGGCDRSFRLDQQHLFFCPPPDATTGTAIKSVIEYEAKASEEIKLQPFIMYIIEALHNKWPCSVVDARISTPRS